MCKIMFVPSSDHKYIYLISQLCIQQEAFSAFIDAEHKDESASSAAEYKKDEWNHVRRF